MMSDIFKVKEMKHKLRNREILFSFVPQSTRYGIDNMAYLATKVWALIPEEAKYVDL